MMNKNNSGEMNFYYGHGLMKILTFVFILLLTWLNGNSQILCGTELTPERIALEKKRIALEKSNLLPPATISTIPTCCLGKTLSLTFWIVKDSTGQPGVSPAIIAQSVDSLNAHFAPICLSFNVCSINYIDDWNYDILIASEEGDQLYTLYQTPKTINVYLSTVLFKDRTTPVCGLAFLPGGPDAIYMGKSCLVGKTFSHEMGHFFGLNHTFETDFGVELANGSNCSTAGDLICDTPADPGGIASADCQLDPYSRDPNGDWYVPQIGNIMSYYSDACSCGFTTQQYNRMCQQYLTLRFYLW
jgi:hypothetical protein